MENPETMSKKRKWLIGTAIVLIYMFFVWFFAPAGHIAGGWFGTDPGKDNVFIALFDTPIIIAYVMITMMIIQKKNEPFLPTGGWKKTVRDIFIVILVTGFLMFLGYNIK